MYIVDNGVVSGGYQGLYIYTSGHVTLAYTDAHNNDNTGIQINNAYSPSAPKNVAINDVIANDNNGCGLDVESYGHISIKGIEVYGNYNGYGAYLENRFGTGNVTITSSKYIPNNSFNESALTGLGLSLIHI